MPTVGDNVVVGAGAKVIGGLTIGDNVLVGVNAVVTNDVPSDSKVVATGGVDIRGSRPVAEEPAAVVEDAEPEISTVS